MAHEPRSFNSAKVDSSLLEIRLEERPVDLVEVDRLDAEPLEAAADLAQDRVPLQGVHDTAARPLDQRSLREDERPLRQAAIAHDHLEWPKP